MLVEFIFVMVMLAMAYTLMFSYPFLMFAVCAIVFVISMEEWIRKGRFKGASLGARRWFFVPGRGFKKMIVVRDGRNLYWYDGKWIVRQNKVNGLMLWGAKEEYSDRNYDRMLKRNNITLEDVAYLNVREMDVMKYGR